MRFSGLGGAKQNDVFRAIPFELAGAELGGGAGRADVVDYGHKLAFGQVFEALTVAFVELESPAKVAHPLVSFEPGLGGMVAHPLEGRDDRDLRPSGELVGKVFRLVEAPDYLPRPVHGNGNKTGDVRR